MSQIKEKEKAYIKKNTLSIQQRLEILKKLKAGDSTEALANEYSVHRSTISRVKSSEEKILHHESILKSCGGNYDKKRFKGAETSLVEQSLYEWYQQHRETNESITGAAVQEKARFFHKKLCGNTPFKASNGWLRRFKERHGIRSTTLLNRSLVRKSEKQLSGRKKAVQSTCTNAKEDVPPVSITEAYHAINILRNFCQCNEDKVSATFLPMIQEFHSYFFNKFYNNHEH